MEGGRGGFKALLETVGGGELSWKQGAMDEWNRMTNSAGKEHRKSTYQNTHTDMHARTCTHVHTESFPCVFAKLVGQDFLVL